MCLKQLVIKIIKLSITSQQEPEKLEFNLAHHSASMHCCSPLRLVEMLHSQPIRLLQISNGAIDDLAEKIR